MLKTVNHLLKNTHPLVGESWSAFQQKAISRRDFLKTATLLGVSFGAASQLASISAPLAAPAAKQPTPKRGGILKAAVPADVFMAMHPADLYSISTANIVSQVAEKLMVSGADNITRPLLAERWRVNRNLDEWTFSLRQGVLFNDGNEMTASDVAATMRYWISDANQDSSLYSLLDSVRDIEEVAPYTVKVYLRNGNIHLPDSLTHYPAAILPAYFEGDFEKQPIGTGPYTIADYGFDSVVLKARPDYWQIAADGLPLPYLDGIEYQLLEPDDAFNALANRSVHTIYKTRPEDAIDSEAYGHLVLHTAPSSQTLILKMRTDRAPWDDVRVRTALKKCQDRQKILDFAWFGYGQLGGDAHIAPCHNAYDSSVPIPEQDIAGAKALLEEWAAETGNSLPLEVTLATKNDEGEEQYALLLKAAAIEAGFDITLDITDAAGYWERWDEVPLGITAWTHRPSAQTFLELGYSQTASGDLVPWNESRWNDAETQALIEQASQTIDILERQAIVGQIQRIFQERGPIGVAFFKEIWRLTDKSLKGVTAHPTYYDIFTFAWLDE